MNPEIPSLFSHLAEIHLLFFSPLKKNHHAQKRLCFIVLNNFVPASLRAHLTNSPVCICQIRDTGCWGAVLMAPVEEDSLCGKEPNTYWARSWVQEGSWLHV